MLTKRTFVRGGLLPARSPEEVASARASRGAVLLDTEVPGWADVIDLGSLDVGEMEVYDLAGLHAGGGCVLCQIDLAINTGIPTSEGCRIPRPGESFEDMLAVEAFYDEQRRLVSDLEADATDNEGDPVKGSYRRLADDLGLVTQQAKVEHGFLTDATTSYAALGDAWSREIEARRARLAWGADVQ